MADILSIPVCGGLDATFNIGIPLCDVIKDIPLGIIGLDSGAGFSAADRATNASFVAKLQTMTRAARGGRAYPFWQLTNFEDQSKEPTKGALGNLTNSEITSSDGTPAFSFQHRIGELFHNKLLKAQNSGLNWMIVDKKYVVYGTLDGTVFRGYSLAEFYVGLSKFGTIGTASIYPFSMTLASMPEYKENGRFIQSDSTIVAATGLRDTTLTLVSQAANVANISVYAWGTNLGLAYAAELAVVGAWVATNKQTGANVTITSVTYNSSLGYYVVTVDNTAYTALSTGQKITVNLDNPTDLYALTLPVSGYESTGGVDITKP